VPLPNYTRIPAKDCKTRTGYETVNGIRKGSVHKGLLDYDLVMVPPGAIQLQTD
jgi:hypothetical protein